jgi:SCF-associated factor 1
MTSIRLPDLPEDILLLIFPYLQATDFLSLCCINKHFYRTFREDSSYWRYHAKNILNLPRHYQSKFEAVTSRQMCETYYKRAKLFIWGNPCRPAYNLPLEQEGHLEWPTEIQAAASLGTIIDVQCAYVR